MSDLIREHRSCYWFLWCGFADGGHGLASRSPGARSEHRLNVEVQRGEKIAGLTWVAGWESVWGSFESMNQHTNTFHHDFSRNFQKWQWNAPNLNVGTFHGPTSQGVGGMYTQLGLCIGEAVLTGKEVRFRLERGRRNDLCKSGDRFPL